MDDMALLADRIVALKDGEIVADGTPKQIFGNRSLILDAGLDLPTATRITDKLIANGINLPHDIVTMDELAEQLCRLKAAKRTDENDGEESDWEDDEDV